MPKMFRHKKFWDIETGEVKFAFRGWHDMKSPNYDNVSLQIDDIRITDKETFIQSSLNFDYQNTFALDWDFRLKDDTGKTYPLTLVDSTVYRTKPLTKDKIYTLEIKNPEELTFVRNVSEFYSSFYVDPTKLKLGENVELNQEIYAGDFQVYLTGAEKLSANEIRFHFFTGSNIESVWLENPRVIGNSISEDGVGRFSTTLTFSEIPNDYFELLVQKVYYKAQGPWIVEFGVFDSMFVR